MSLGEDRVRVKFNPSSNSQVDHLKTLAAAFINACEDLRKEHSDNYECQRLWSLAQTHAEDAAMWAVKAVTYEG